MAEEEEVDDVKQGIAAAIAAGKKIGRLDGPRFMMIEGVPFQVRSEDIVVESCEELLPAPKRARDVRTFRTTVSFAEYFLEFADHGSRVYADGNAAIVGVLNDHAVDPDAKDAGCGIAPRWGDHKALLVLQESDEWIAWTKINKQKLGHLDLVEFLQEQISTIESPDAAEILGAARTFSAARSAKFEQVIPVEGGDLSVGFSEEVRGTTKSGQATMPSRLVLQLRPFRKGKAYRVEAQLRWRLSREGELSFTVALLRLRETIEAAFDDVIAEVEKLTERKVLV